MKKLVLGICSVSLVLGSCQSSRMASYTDDVYANPAEEKRIAAQAAAEKAKREAEERQKAEAERLAQKAKDDANPYYKDPEFNKDDYYDYEYASRVRRFHNPVYGTGYYDNWYTNSYWYSGNPAFYGSSIYGNSTWGLMPSVQFNSYYNNWGWGLGYGNYYNGWNNPWGWNNGWSYPGWGYYNNPNAAYWAGYNQGYYNGWYGQPYGWNNGWNNGGWGYFNSFDVNSGYSHVGPRTSVAGGNSSRMSYAGMSLSEAESTSRKFFDNVIASQQSTPKFSEEARPRKIRQNTSVGSGAGLNPSGIEQGSTLGTGQNSSGGSVRSGNEGGILNWTRNRIERAEGGSSNPVMSGSSGSENAGPTRGNNTIRGGKINETPATEWNTNTGTNRSSGGGGSNSGGGGNSSPRGSSGSGGSSRPR